MKKKMVSYKTVSTCVQCPYYRVVFGEKDKCLGDGTRRDKDLDSIMEEWCPLEDVK